MKRVLLYAHDAVGLGHIRRVCRIADGLARLHGDVTTLVLSGSSVADALPFPEGSDVVKLPSLRKYHNGAYGARHLHVDDKSIVRMRTAMIGAAFRTFEPDLVIVDKVAAGVHGELVPALRTLRRLNPNAQIVLSLRDILDDPASVRRGWAKDGTLDTIRELYDRVFVWGMPEICDVVTEYSMPADIAAKVEYCGYLASEDRDGDTSPKKSPTRKRLVVTTVGGGEDGGRILSTFVKSLAHTRESFASVVVMGPDLPEQTRSEIRRLVQHSTRPVFAVDFTRHLDRLFDACDLVVSMGGYNTMTEVVSRGRRAIVVPRVHPRTEQLIRARRLEEAGHVRMLHPNDLTPQSLADALDTELRAEPRTPVQPLVFSGLERAVQVLLGGSRDVFAPTVEPRRAIA